jgi:hypothetical protein
VADNVCDGVCCRGNKSVVYGVGGFPSHGDRLGIGVLVAGVVTVVTRSFSWQSAVREYNTHNTPSMVSEAAFTWVAAVLIDPTKARKENMIKSYQIYAGKWARKCFIVKDLQKISAALGKPRADLIEGKHCILILSRLGIARRHLVEKAVKRGDTAFELRSYLEPAAY